VGVAVLVGCVLAACGGGTASHAGGAPQHGTTTTSATTTPLRLDTAAAVARTLTTIERGLRAPGDPLAAVYGAVQSQAYGTLVSHPEWRAAVLAAVAPDVASEVGANLDASVSLDSLTTGGALSATLPPWTIVAPPPEATLLADYMAAQAATGVPWGYLAGIHLIESRLGRIVGPSSAGAQGPMQFLPSTFAEYGQGGNIGDAHDAIFAAARLLAAHGGATDINRALLAYNDDQRYTKAVEDYAGVLAASPAEFDGYYQWPVVYETSTGTYVLPVGYPAQPAERKAG
jgi:Transglycosylase SLT domain